MHIRQFWPESGGFPYGEVAEPAHRPSKCFLLRRYAPGIRTVTAALRREWRFPPARAFRRAGALPARQRFGPLARPTFGSSHGFGGGDLGFSLDDFLDTTLHEGNYSNPNTRFALTLV